MGGCTNERTIQCYTEEFAKKAMQSIYDQDLIENGHDVYSGSWGSNSGISLFDKKYQTYEEALIFAETHATKGDDILCVSFYASKNDKKTEEFDKSIANIKLELKTFITNCLNERKSKRKTATCVHCGDNKTLVANVNISSKCPKCNKDHFYLSQTEFKKLTVLKDRIKRVETTKQTYLKSLTKKTNTDELVKKFKDIKSKVYTLEKELKDLQRVETFRTCSKCQSKVSMELILMNLHIAL